MAEDTGGLLGFFGRGYDPAAAYGGLLSEPSTEDAFKARALAAMAGAFGRGALPSPYKGGTPFLATLGQAAEAAYGGQDELIKARTQAAQQSLYGTQAEAAKQNLQLGRAYILSRMQDAADDKAGGGGLLGKGPAGLVGGGKDGETYWTAEGLAALRPTEGKYDQIHYPSGTTKDGVNSSASGAYGFIDPTWIEFATKAGVDVAKYPRAYMAPPAVQDAVAAITPIHHWTGVDANRKPFNAAAQKLATNPAYITGGGTSAAGAPASAAGDLPPSLIAEVPRFSAAFGGAPGAEPPPSPPPAAGAVDRFGQPAPPGYELAPGQPGKMRPLPAESLLGPQPGAPSPTMAAAPGPPAPSGGLLGPQIPEAVAALAQQAGPRPAQFAGPGAADPGTPPPGGPTLVPGGAARPPIAPVVGPMPPASLLAPQQPAPIMPAGPPTLPPGAQPGAMPPPPVSSPGAVPATGPVPGAPTPDRIRRAQEQAAILTVLGKPLPPDTAAILKYNIDVASAGAQAAAKAGGEQPFVQQNAAQAAQVKAQYDLWVKQNEPQLIRKGTTYIDQTTGRTIQNPDEVKTVDKQGNEYLWHSYPSLTPDGVPRLVPLGQSKLGPGAEETLKLTAGAQPITVGNQVMQQGPGYTQPITTAAGSIIPPASGSTPISGTKSNLDKRGEDFAKVESDWGKSVAPATQAVNRVQAIMAAMKEYETGTWASKKSEIVGMLKSVGINLGNAVDDPAQAQIILKNNFGTALNIMQSTGLSRWTQAELFGAQANSANPDLWAKANHAIGAQTIGVIDWEQQMLKDYREFKKYAGGMVDPQDFQQRWVEANPLQPFVDRAHERIGPLKGEPAGPAGGADVPVLRSPGDIKGLRPGDRYSRPGDPAGSYRTVPAAR